MDRVDPRKSKKTESPAPPIRSSPAAGRDLREDLRLSGHEGGTTAWPSPLESKRGISVKAGPPSPRPRTLEELPWMSPSLQHGLKEKQKTASDLPGLAFRGILHSRENARAESSEETGL